MSASSYLGSRNRKLLAFCFLLSSLFLGISSESVSAQSSSGSEEERISRYATDIRLDLDAVLFVTETIEYDFGINERHGIYRDIPVRYETAAGNRQSIVISVNDVMDESGRAYPYQLSDEGENLRIKIGDPDRVVSGRQTYRIHYSVRYAVGYFDAFDEIYWNAVGHRFLVPIENVSIAVTIPEGVYGSTVQQSCYSGAFGDTRRCDEYGRWEGNTYSVTLPYALQAGEGVTVAVGFPKGIVVQPKMFSRAFSFIIDNPITLFPLVVFGGMFFLWYRIGRDPYGRGVIIAEYVPPEALSVLETAGLLKGSITSEHISAAIIELATTGFLIIRKTEKKILFLSKEDYVFKRTEKPVTDPLRKKTLESLFGSDTPNAETTLSDLKEKFFRHIPEIEKLVFERLVGQKYFPESPKKVLGRYILFGFAAAFVAFVVWRPESPSAVIAVALSFVIYGAFILVMPKVTRSGALMKERLLGLKEYLQIAEKDRIAFHNAPEKRPELFEALLPFAMVFGVEKAWAKEFQDMYTTPPSWYQGQAAGHFSSVSFVSGLDEFHSAAASTLASAPGGSSGSGGGGFSGGGGGGGGGGSW